MTTETMPCAGGRMPVNLETIYSYSLFLPVAQAQSFAAKGSLPHAENRARDLFGRSDYS